MKKWIAMLLALVFCVGMLAGCKSDDTPDTQKPDETPETPDGTPDEAPDETPDETPDTPAPVSATHITFTVGDATEGKYIVENQGGYIDTNGNRYADLERYFIYRFTFDFRSGNAYRLYSRI